MINGNFRILLKIKGNPINIKVLAELELLPEKESVESKEI